MSYVNTSIFQSIAEPDEKIKFQEIYRIPHILNKKYQNQYGFATVYNEKNGSNQKPFAILLMRCYNG